MYSGLGSFGCIHIIMGNKTSSEGGEGERGAKSGNSSYVDGPRVDWETGQQVPVASGTFKGRS